MYYLGSLGIRAEWIFVNFCVFLLSKQMENLSKFGANQCVSVRFIGYRVTYFRSTLIITVSLNIFWITHWSNHLKTSNTLINDNKQNQLRSIGREAPSLIATRHSILCFYYTIHQNNLEFCIFICCAQFFHRCNFTSTTQFELTRFLMFIFHGNDACTIALSIFFYCNLALVIKINLYANEQEKWAWISLSRFLYLIISLSWCPTEERVFQISFSEHSSKTIEFLRLS